SGSSSTTRILLAMVLRGSRFARRVRWKALQESMSGSARELLPVFEVLRLGREDDVLRDVGRVVADPFQAAGDEHEIDLLTRRVRIALDLGDGIADQIRLDRVDLVVRREHGARPAGVEIRERTERLRERALARLGQGPQL